MFIAHLPAGYLLTRAIQNRFKVNWFFWVGLLASVLPDFDLLYFYLIDHRQTLHHEYITHLPLFWLAVWAAALIVAPLMKRQEYLVVTTIFFSNIFLHLLLDTVVGGVAWLYPFSQQSFELAVVPATHDFWVWSFVFHRSFLLELVIILVAAYMLFYHVRSRYGARV
mgnify:CR=1 FL=1